MARRLTGIELRKDGLSAVELKASRRSFRLQNAATIDFDGEAGLAGALEELFEKRGFSRRALVSLAPSDSRVFLHRIQTALPRLQQVRAVLRSQIEDSVPIAFEDIVADIGDTWPKRDEPGQKALLAAAMNRGELEEITDAFDAVGVSPEKVVPAASALSTVVDRAGLDMAGRDFVVLHFDATRSLIAFYRSGAQALVRVMAPVDWERDAGAGLENVAREIGLGWRRLFDSVMPDDVRVLISVPESGKETGAGFFERLPGEVRYVALKFLASFKGTLPDEYLIPAALAMQAADGSRPNFIRVLKEEAQASGQPVALIAAAGVLVIALAAVSIARLYLIHNRFEQTNTEVERAIAEEFRQVLPESEYLTHPPDVLEARLRERLERLRQSPDGQLAAAGKQHNLTALLSAFNSSIPDGYRIELERIVIDPDSMRVNGRAGSIGEAEELRTLLSEWEFFDDVVISITSRSGAEAGFELNLSVKP